ncbi:hypothetical protein Z517_00300 [Fonsecaea pedrosoi CBS 271.37]|uniref:Unplaced genomic scaffold supercont1.1, whole genome shotgun sequence n=1 Tax=Fonsecaea pedrosoi CBS 271.37 TaxID=1442368 RepID=A0A0D2FE73_9EURO|nr:uncharacterized protein Z517_00300 [Fonsecaea pedrosoi CBS 271.37]KIW84912.1 hypothetical protein Z517_00300 [Fonsecaea pedrosoi CBS 271.37]
MTYKSKLPAVTCPEDVTVWSWLFDSPSFQQAQNRGVTNAVSGDRITFAELKTYAEQLSVALVRDHGLRPAETVLLMSGNNIWYPVAMFAALRAGARVAGVTPASTVEELSHVLRLSHARYFMTVPTSAAVVMTAARDAGIPLSRVFLLEGRHGDLVNIHRLIQTGSELAMTPFNEPFKIPPGTSNRDLCGYLSFTSGTTGRPKAVSRNPFLPFFSLAIIMTTELIDAIQFTGLVNLLHLPIYRNAEILMLPKFTMESMLDAIVKYRLTEVLMVPPIIVRLLQEEPMVSRYDLSSIRRFTSGSAPLPEDVLGMLQDKFPNTGFKQGWGMTETCCCITATDPAHYDFKYARTAGVILANTEIKILDENGAEADVGEILVRGPQCTMGYLDNPEETRGTFLADGWLRTGDMGRMDAEGCLTITGRIKDLIKVKGVGVAPAELEDVLISHPHVQDAGVLGVPHSYKGEVPYAFVVLHKDVQPSRGLAEELIQHVRARKSRPKWVVGVSFVQAIPRGPNGKILRRQMQKFKPELKL